MRCRPAERCDGTQQGEKRRVWKTSQTSGAFYPSCEVHVTALRKLLMTFENLNPFVRCSAGPPDGFRRAYLLSWPGAQPSTGRRSATIGAAKPRYSMEVHPRGSATSINYTQFSSKKTPLSTPRGSAYARCALRSSTSRAPRTGHCALVLHHRAPPPGSRGVCGFVSQLKLSVCLSDSWSCFFESKL